MLTNPFLDARRLEILQAGSRPEGLGQHSIRLFRMRCEEAEFRGDAAPCSWPHRGIDIPLEFVERLLAISNPATKPRTDARDKLVSINAFRPGDAMIA